MKNKIALFLIGIVLLPALAFAQFAGGSYDGYCIANAIVPGDTLPPTPVTDFQVLDSLYNVKLGWTVPYDSLNALKLYDIRYSTSSIDENNWNAADTCTGEPTPKESGYSQTFIVQGLLDTTHYYFALKTEDRALNWSDISNCVDVTTSEIDSFPPSPVTDLQVTAFSSLSLTLGWHAPGDDGIVGTASYYDIRYSTSPITESNWGDADTCSGEPIPQPQGSTETFIVQGLLDNTQYYFALKTADEYLNWSIISNCASGTTGIEDEIEIRFNSLFPDGLMAGEQFIKFPQYYETPYKVIGFTFWGSEDFSIYLYPDDGNGLPNTSNLLGSYSFSPSNITAWRTYSIYGAPYSGIVAIDPTTINNSGPLWVRFVHTGRVGYETSYPDGRSYYYSRGEYHQYEDRDIMLSLNVSGAKLENDIEVKTIDNPYRVTAPAMHDPVPRATIRNNGQSAATFTANCVIKSEGVEVYNENVEIYSLEPDSVARVAFPSWSVGEEGTTYCMKIYTELSNDLATFNDTLSRNMTASYTETFKYTSYDLPHSVSTFSGGDPSDVLTRITPSAYPAQIMEMDIFLNEANVHQVPLRVYSDSNSADFYTFKPGELIWSDTRPGNSSYGYNVFDISEEKIVIDKSDAEAYVGYLYSSWSNIFNDWNTAPQYIFPQRHGLTWGYGYFIWYWNLMTKATVRYTEYGSLSGTVIYSLTQEPIENALVTIGLESAYTDPSGSYLIENLVSGDDYTVRCDALDQGYNVDEVNNVEIVIGETTDVDFSLTSPNMIISPDIINTTMASEDTVVTYITVSNDGNGPLDYNITTIITEQSKDNVEKVQFRVSPPVINKDIGEPITRSIDNIEYSEFGESYVDTKEIRNKKCSAIDSEISGWYTVANVPNGKRNRLDDWYTFGSMDALYFAVYIGPERVTYFNPADFGLEYPFYINKLSHWFYEHSSYPWDDDTFHFKIYAEDGETLFYESEDIEAQHMVEIVHELSSPVAISSGGFYFGVAPVSSSGFPSSCADNLYTGSNHSYYGSTGNWTLWSASPDKGEYIQSVYLSPCNIWITVEPYSGTLESGSTGTVTITCYTENADLGTTLNENIIFSSSPDVGCDTVRVTLTVGGGIIGDFNSDGYVDAADMQLFGDHWHFIDTDTGWDSLYDLVPDGIIDAADMQVFGDHWHEGTPPKYVASGKSGKGPNENAGIRFDLDATTYGNQNQTSMAAPSVGDYIRVDAYAINVHNLDTYEFEVLYNPSQIEYITTTSTNPITYEENILTSDGGEAICWMVDTSNPGVLSIAYTLTGTDTTQAPEGEGLIADIVFQTLATEQDSLLFGVVKYYDSFGVMDVITDKGTADLPLDDFGLSSIFQENRLENYPNPFRAQTTISYAIKGRKKIDEVELKIYNLRGQLVESMRAIDGTAVLNTEHYSSGIYFYKVSCENESITSKMLIIR